MVRIPFAGGTLEAEIDPAGVVIEGRDAVVLCHPHPAFGGRMNNALLVALSRGFTKVGMTALRFNYRGIGASDGVATGGLEEETDVLAATQYLEAAGATRVAWVGYSFGAVMGWKAIAMGSRPPAFVGVAIPTAVVEEGAERQAAIERVVSSGVPIALITGDSDPICKVDRLRAWIGDRPILIDTLEGEAHAFSLAGMRGVTTRTVRFVSEVMKR